MPRYKCPICGDQHVYKFWVDPRPPLGCPYDDDWQHDEGEPSVTDVTQCQWQMAKAWQAAEFRKLVPDAFDEVGTMRPGQLARVIEIFHEAHPEKRLVI